MAVFVVAADETLAKQRLSELLKDLRGHQTQRQFAKLLGTSYTSIQDWEKSIRLPSKKNLKRIAQLKDWSYEKLVFFLFASDPQATLATTDPLELIMSCLEKLTVVQKQQLLDYLSCQIPHSEKTCPKKLRDKPLSISQKHNLHLLLRASLKQQDPVEARDNARIEPDLFADIFLRNDENRQLGYSELEQFSRICCQVIQWRGSQLPEIHPHQTYTDQVDDLWDALSGEISSRLTKTLID